MAEIILLNRIRVDIGNVSGSLSELMQYAGMAGFNDNYEPQAKPRLVGTWTINDWYTTAQLAQAQAAFDGLTIVGDPNYVLDFSQMAVQVLDNTQPNYNPAVAIVFEAAGYGVTLNTAPFVGQKGRWFITKAQAATITQTDNLFWGKSTINDTNLIVSDTVNSYDFKSFSEFQYFTAYSIVVMNFFSGCTKLETLVLPSSILSFQNDVFWNTAESLVNIYIKQQNVVLANAYHIKRFIVGTGYKYSDLRVYESYKTQSSGYLCVPHYTYCAPLVSYDGANVTMSVQRISDIYYTLDGSTPTTSSIRYTEPFAWDGTGVIKAMAIDKTLIVGDIQYADDFYAQTCINPVITVDSTNNQVTISCATPGAIIHYTTDGTYPTLDSPVYSAPITSQEDVLKVRCFATATGYNDSEVVSKICVLDDSLWGTDGDNSSFAVQCMDGTKPNYNPAVCIILDNNNKLTDKLIGGGGGYLTKTGAATITSIGTWFRSKISVVDTNGIVSSDTTRSYNFESFDEFEYFTGFSTIPEYAFNGCTKLTTITLSNNVKRLESLFSDHQGVFQNCTSLVSINLDEGLEYIGNRTFAGCTNLNVTEIPSSVTYIGDQAFKLCTSLVSLDVKANIDTIRSGCFGGCSSLRYIKFYSDIKTINNASTGSTNGAFTSCSNLETIIFGESLETIGTSGDGNGSFANCNKLIITKLPNSIKNIGAYAFYKCTSIPYLHIEATTPPTLTPDTWGRTPNYFDGATFKIYVGDGSSAADDNAILADYLAATNWATYSSRLDTWYNYLHPAA